MKRKPYKTYTREFKRDAVRLADAGNKPVAEIARELGVHRNQIARWKAQLHPAGTGLTGSAAASGAEASLREEVDRLRDENRRLTEENVVLRKAAMYFARNQAA